MRFRFPLAILFVGLLVPRPAAAAANKEHLQLMAEIRMLQEQQQQLQTLIGSLQDAIKAVSTKIDDQNAAARKAAADQLLAVNNINDSVRVLREKADDTNVKLSTVSTEIDALRQAITAMPPAQTVSPAPGTPGAPTSGAPTEPSTPSQPGSTPPPAPMPPMSAQRNYDASYDDYTANRYDLAIDGFTSFIQNFPRAPQAAAAQYNIGMSYFNQSKWDKARDAFQAVLTNYPQQTDVNSDACYKLGQTYERLNQVEQAKTSYQTAVQKYPGTFSATQAKQALDRLNRK